VSRRGASRQPTLVWVLAVIIVVMILVAGWQIVEVGASGYYAFQPGTAPRITADPRCRATGGSELVLPDGTPCARLVVPVHLAHPIRGSLYMVDVLVGPATPGQYILSKLGLLHTVESGTQLIPAGAVLGTTPPSQLPCQDAQQMTSATSSATVVALRELGYQVKEENLGAQLVEVVPGTPAAAAGLECNDVVIAVNSAAVHTADDFVAAIHAAHPGQTIQVTVHRAGTGGKLRTVTLPVTLTGTPALGGQPAQPNKPFLGVASMTQTVFVYPFDVTIDVGSIGGPSAGLALTLGLLDVLSAGNLTGGHRIAATGTINLDGTVGDVGGVAQKAVAVRKAGAQVFFVPPDELKDALSQAGSMKVMPVATLQQALNDLKALGGHIPAPALKT
jgi:PDZ domain-containing protein